MINSKTLILLLLFISNNISGQPLNKFSGQTVSKDLDFLYNTLIETHYNIYAYTTEEEFKEKYLKLKHSIAQDTLTLLETINLYQQLVASIKNGHTSIDFPFQSYINYAKSGGTIFPLELVFENRKALVRKNWSSNEMIKNGDEILSINGKEINEVLSQIYNLVSAERQYFKNVKIELFSFPRYYWQVYGKVDEFNIEVKSNGSTSLHTINSVNLIEGFEQKRDEIINPKAELKFYEQAAYLNPGNFSGDEDQYQKFIDSAFALVNEKKISNLIIDFKNNGGGNDSFSDYLISYFADKPFHWNSSFTLKTSQTLKNIVLQNNDTTERYWKEIVNRENGEIYNYEFDPYTPQPENKRYKGKVFVMVNRQSHSQSAVAAAQIQDYGFATIVGEETGDYPSLYASIFQFALPETNITVNVSKGYIIRVNGSTKEEGVIPDIQIKDYLLDENDEILTGLLEIINKSK
ncbi:S41 family peptidase [Marinigracilibium pacificum]|uniref:Peptidase S41 n=1 Tax=Marinigracilibium pacificum TaxID=2729599 RepID=A0A848IX29_9BACT|nr:S41 family peptidase [Marinigracilibium pacificum]NMM47835.1 peptidase S41 [Marinigracilibium pacificum]